MDDNAVKTIFKPKALILFIEASASVLFYIIEPVSFSSSWINFEETGLSYGFIYYVLGPSIGDILILKNAVRAIRVTVSRNYWWFILCIVKLFDRPKSISWFKINKAP